MRTIVDRKLQADEGHGKATHFRKTARNLLLSSFADK
jgi:hypothetical protein